MCRLLDVNDWDGVLWGWSSSLIVFLCFFVPLQCMAHRWSDCSVSEIGCDYTCSAICLHFWSGRFQVTAGILVEYLICSVWEVYMIYCWNKCCLEIYFLWVFLLYIFTSARTCLHLRWPSSYLWFVSTDHVKKLSSLCIQTVLFALMLFLYIKGFFLPFRFNFYSIIVDGCTLTRTRDAWFFVH